MMKKLGIGAAIVALMLWGGAVYATWLLNVKNFGPSAVGALQSDSTSFAAFTNYRIVIDKVTTRAQATSTSSSFQVWAGLRGSIVDGVPSGVNKTIEHCFGSESAVNGAWYTKEFLGPFPCTADSGLVVWTVGANTDSTGAQILWHYERKQ